VAKVKSTYTPPVELGDCSRCDTKHLQERYGDTIIEGQPVCYACTCKTRATERSEGARTSEARQPDTDA